MDRQGMLSRLAKMEQESLEGGGQARIEQQHGRGKWTARERIDAFLDPDSFMEIDPRSSPVYRAGASARWVTVSHLLVSMVACMSRAHHGLWWPSGAQKICKVDHAMKTERYGRANDSGGARLRVGSLRLVVTRTFSSRTRWCPV